MNISYIKDLINEYYKKAPWYDLDGKEIACDEFIMINLEEKEYEEKQKRRRVYQNDVTNNNTFSRKNS